MNYYTIEVNYENSHGDKCFSVVCIPYTKKMSHDKIQSILESRFGTTTLSWKLI